MVRSRRARRFASGLAAAAVYVAAVAAPASAHQQVAAGWLYLDVGTYCVNANVASTHDGSGRVDFVNAQTISYGPASCSSPVYQTAVMLRSRSDVYKSLYPNAQLCVVGPSWTNNPTSGSYSYYSNSVWYPTPTSCSPGNYVVGSHQAYFYGAGWYPSGNYGTLITVS